EAFRGFELEHERSFLRTRTSLRGTVDLARGLAAFGDEELTAALGGLPLGVSEEELERALGVPVAQAFGLQVAVDLPGRTTTNAPTRAGSAAVWAPRLGEQVVIEATAEGWDLGTALPLGVALSGAAGLAALGFRRTRRVRR
ncbi:MAG TPA: hypothetical protein VFO65_05155, partial [Acidimicrobiales bacterium]|nr:hypothetical protein [Acidimicrobiales bacterium]